MTITEVLTASRDLVVSRIIKVHTDGSAPWAIAHVLDLETLQPVVPKRSIFLNVMTLRTRFQYFQLGPFKTPFELDLMKHGLPKSGDIILGKVGTNYKGEMYVSWLPDRWARPASYFLFYLFNTYKATSLYENKDPTLRMVLLSRLTVPYDTTRDERLYDMLCLILFDDTDTLLEMCYNPQHRPKNGRKWNLMDKGQLRKIAAFCAKMGESYVEVPSVTDFVEEVAYLVSDSGICAHFRSILTTSYQESKSMFNHNVNKWLIDKDCMSSKLIQTLIDRKK
jgi:hypothetical protein